MLDIQPLQRRFLPADLKIGVWDDARSYAEDLVARDLATMDDFQKFLEDGDELDRVLAEEAAKRYIAMSCNTADEAIKKSFDDFQEFIQPEITRYAEQVNRKLVASAFAEQMDEAGFTLLLRRIESSLKLFREENIPLQTEEAQLSAESDQIKGAMTVEWESEQLTMPQAGDILRRPERAAREKIWFGMRERFLQDADKLDDLYARLVALRQQIAVNAGEENYRDYMFKALNRFDYTPEDCFRFHDAVEQAVVPVVDALMAKRQKALAVADLRPWDLGVDPHNRPAIQAFDDADDLIAKGVTLLDQVDPFFGDVLKAMKAKNLLDIASRPNKAPGGYNYLLQETNLPFMFGNVTQKPDDVNLLIHEMGHACHDISSGDLRFSGYKSYPIEAAELASMSMELLVFDKLSVYYADDQDLKRAQREHLEKIIEYFPWMMMVDAFQHEVYTHPDWSADQRNQAWLKLAQRFQGNAIDWSGLERFRPQFWHKQGHVFSVPFYYIEYAIAQLGALQIWRNYKRDPAKTLVQYKAALRLGYTVSLPEIYATAGIEFNFSATMLKDLMAFVQEELRKLD